MLININRDTLNFKQCVIDITILKRANITQ